MTRLEVAVRILIERVRAWWNRPQTVTNGDVVGVTILIVGTTAGIVNLVALLLQVFL